MAYLGKTPSQAVRSRYYFTATGGETSLSGADDNANTLTFTDGNYVDVALNGVTLVAGTDYNTTTANTIGGLTALVASDVVEVIVYDTFSVFSGNVNGDFTVGGTLTAASYSGLPTTTLTSLGIPNHDDITVDGSGNVGIGTSSPDFKAEIVGGTNNGLHIKDAESATVFGGLFTQSANLALVVRSNHALTLGTNDAERLRIDSSGNVGIGTVPSDILHIKDSASTNVLIDAPTDNASLTLQCGSSDAGAEGAFIQFIQNTTAKWQLGMNTDNSFRLYNYNTTSEALQVDPSGNLLVGQSTTALPGLGNTTSGISLAGQYDIIAASRTSGAAVLVNRNTDDGSLIEFSRNGSTVGSIAATTRGGATDIFIGSGDTGIYFTQALDAIAPSNQGSDRDAAIDLGRSASRFKDLYLSGGVFLGGVGSANYLDDYEEGTWTPQIWKNATQVTSPISALGVYRKIGNVIFYSFYFYKSSGSNTDNNEWTLRGMPFSMEAGGNGAFVSLTSDYTGINSVNYFDQAGSHRWQANGNAYFSLYGPQSTTQWTTGYLEFSGSGFVYAL